MGETVTKSRFKRRTLGYLRSVQETREGLIITERGRPVVKIEPYCAGQKTLRFLRGCVVRFDTPAEPVALEDWGMTH